MPNILVVDDSAFFRKSVRMSLEDRHFNVFEAEMLKELKDNEFSRDKTLADMDLILLDIHLSSESGFEILPELREKYPETPVIMISVDDSENTILNAFELRAHDFLPKPFDDDVLIDKINYYLELEEQEIFDGDSQETEVFDKSSFIEESSEAEKEKDDKIDESVEKHVERHEEKIDKGENKKAVKTEREKNINAKEGMSDYEDMDRSNYMKDEKLSQDQIEELVEKIKAQKEKTQNKEKIKQKEEELVDVQKTEAEIAATASKQKEKPAVSELQKRAAAERERSVEDKFKEKEDEVIHEQELDLQETVKETDDKHQAKDRDEEWDINWFEEEQNLMTREEKEETAEVFTDEEVHAQEKESAHEKEFTQEKEIAREKEFVQEVEEDEICIDEKFDEKKESKKRSEKHKEYADEVIALNKDRNEFDYFKVKLLNEIQRSTRSKLPFCVIKMGFITDEILTKDSLSGVIRSIDHVYTIDTNEFIFLLPYTDKHAMNNFVDRVVTDIKSDVDIDQLLFYNKICFPDSITEEIDEDQVVRYQQQIIDELLN